jgi:hypothetical protein
VSFSQAKEAGWADLGEAATLASLFCLYWVRRSVAISRKDSGRLVVYATLEWPVRRPSAANRSVAFE